MNIKYSLTILLAFLFCVTSYAQSVPQGMKYQAVARDQQGQVLANHDINLRIDLNLGEKAQTTVYSETHEIRTNELGLFAITIGEGEILRGTFIGIPWSSDEVWMEIALDENNTGDYYTISSSKLLAVPYAFHAGSAEKLSDSEESQRNGGIYWHILGNANTVPGITFIGTTDFKDFVMKTNNLEALRITAMQEVQMQGDLDVSGDANIDGIATFSNTTQSTTKDNGAVIVEGGVGIEKNTNIGGNTEVDGTLGVDGVSTFKNTTGSTSKDNGAVVVEGGLGVEENVNVGGNVDVKGISKLNGQVTIDANITGGLQDDYTQYPLQVQGGDHGVAIQINNVTPDRNANFLTMFDGAGSPMGRIEGFQALTGVARATVENILDGLADDPDDVNENSTPGSADSPSDAAQFFNSDYGFGLLNETYDLVLSALTFATNVVGCAAGFGILGDCDDAVWSGIEFGAQFIVLAGYLAYNEINRGVAFESGGADYAEWLMKDDANEVLSFGDVVGVKGGMISKSFTEAEKFMVVSQNPTVIGAMPEASNARMFEKIAFMGQAPVKVVGVANRGDYIIPSGKGDGLAIAVAPEKMKTKDFARIIGIAWGEADGEKMYEFVNTAVGINTNDLVATVDRMQQILNEMQYAIKQVNPDYSPQFFDVDENNLVQNGQTSPTYQNVNQLAAQQMGIDENTSFAEAMTSIQNYTAMHGINLGDYPYILDVMNNPQDQELAQQMLDHYTSVLEDLNEIRSLIGNGN
jgi:hypothetical protein